MYMKATTCVKCKSSVQYTTNKPKLCKPCREEKEKQFKSQKTKPFRSKKEGQMQKILNILLPDEEYIDNGYYSWMLSPKGAPLQLDRYYPNLGIAFEYNGRQHYEFNSWMHSSREAFEYLRKCDLRKRRECRKKGITLITIKYTKDITKEYLTNRLRENGVDL